jgi:hypothetical protein
MQQKTMINRAALPFMIFVCTIVLSACNPPESQSWDFVGLRLTLSSPRFRYKVGDEVTVTAVVENVTGQTIIWESAKTANPEYVFDVNVDGVTLSSLYPELRVYRRELNPGEKVAITYTFKPKPQPHSIFVEAHIYSHQGMIESNRLISLNYGVPSD